MRHQTVGTRAQVFHGTAKHTSGGLEKHDLMQNKSGRIVSRRKHNTAKREMRLVKHGFGTKKGKFGFVKIGSRKSKRHLKGGAAFDNAASLDYAMSATSGSSGAFVDSVSATSVNNSPLMGGRRGRGRRGRKGHRGGSPLMPAPL
jgi:hypothetical protein